MAWPQEPVFFALLVGLVAGGGVVCVRVEPPPDLQAGASEAARPRLQFCCRFNLGTPGFGEPSGGSGRLLLRAKVVRP